MEYPRQSYMVGTDIVIILQRRRQWDRILITCHWSCSLTTGFRKMETVDGLKQSCFSNAAYNLDRLEWLQEQMGRKKAEIVDTGMHTIASHLEYSIINGYY